MIETFMNAMRLQAQKAAAGDVVSRIGTVTSYDPTTHTARVQLQPDNVLTGWLPIASHWIGNGWGLFSPPTPGTPPDGDMCTVVFIDGDVNAGYIDGRFWNNTDQPLSVQSGEWWLVHKKGASFKLTNDGKVTFSDGQGAQIQFDGAGNIVSQANNWTHTGAMDLNGVTIDTSGNVDSPATVTASTDVVGGGKHLKTHTHSGVTSGGSDTGPPV